MDGSPDRRVSARAAAGKPQGRRPIRAIIVMLVVLVVLLVMALVGFLVLSGTSAFTIASIDAEATEHLSAENIAKLANVEEGTTLLTIDETVITRNLKRNPWVGSVSFVREFPDQLRIVVTEREVDCLVKMSTGSVCWRLGDDNVWIEPVNLSASAGQSADDVALALAQEEGAILITDVPTSVSPSAGSVATDEVLKAVNAYREQLSEELVSQIVRFSAAGVESISCTLKSGVEVSLGAPNNIDVKEAVLQEILKKHPNQITYVNVRVPSQPSYRKLGVDTVTTGSGVKVDANATQDTDAAQQTGDGTDATGRSGADGGSASDQGSQGTGGAGEGGGTGSTEDLILGSDGVYYTYEQYYGLDG